jgi:hypothetical protein
MAASTHYIIPIKSRSSKFQQPTSKTHYGSQATIFIKPNTITTLNILEKWTDDPLRGFLDLDHVRDGNLCPGSVPAWNSPQFDHSEPYLAPGVKMALQSYVGSTCIPLHFLQQNTDLGGWDHWESVLKGLCGTHQ